ncbi:MAG: tripartite tricarboxylate transporter substrate binding protein [Pseudomonadota bacterium]
MSTPEISTIMSERSRKSFRRRIWTLASGLRALPRMLPVLAAAYALLGAGVGAAHAETWPAKPIKFVVGWPTGGGTDAVARLVAPHLAKGLGQQIIIENRGGAGGRIGTKWVAQAAPDGYTLLFHADSELPPLALNAQLTPKLMQFEPLKDFSLISLVGRGAYMVVTSAAFPANTLSELIAYCKNNPGKVNYGSFGVGSLANMLGEMLNVSAGIRAVEIPYKGSGPLTVALSGGHIDFSFVPPLTALPLIKAGKLKGLAILAPKRLSAADDIPTTTEAGLPGFVGGSWYALLAPPKTPKPIIDRLNAELASTLASPELKKSFEFLNILPLGSTPEDLGRFIQVQLAKRKQVAAILKIDLE